MNTYNPQSIEKKWQEIWLQKKSYKTREDLEKSGQSSSKRKKSYILDMFPYPSGAGLHVGHPEGYTATDIFSRFLRARGENVLHPMGWDAFGLPAENYAIQTGVHPAKSTKKNTDTFRRQIQSLGFSYDWDREINTSEPEYYKWTQWIFLQLYKAGLVYRKKAKVNWCDTCQTVLANEQVIDGMCERSKDSVIQKDLEQWFFKITAYADELVNDLEDLDWPQPIKMMQKNWIGKSIGAEIDFLVSHTDHHISVFTTRPDTLYGATYVVLAPEHPLISEIVSKEQKEAVEQYQKKVLQKTERERNTDAKEKTGVYTGATAYNPATKQHIPIWIAEYVVMTYASGAIMAVPAHDERDFEFAHIYDLPVVPVIEIPDGHSLPYTQKGVLKNSEMFSGMHSDTAAHDMIETFHARKTTTYTLRDWLISRQRYWGAPIPIVYDSEGVPHPIKEEHLPLLLPEDVDYTPKGTSPLATSLSYKELAEKLYGKGWYFEKDTMDTFVCSSWYYLRYCDPHNSEAFASSDALQKWLPVDMYVGGAEHAVLHLLYARFFHKALQDIGLIPKEVGREPFARLRNQGMILGEDNQKMSKSIGNVINPDDVIAEYGADTLRLYEMFMGPFEDVKPWNTAGIKGLSRFLQRVWDVVIESQNFSHKENVSYHIHTTIEKVTHDIEGFRFNTAISAMMQFINERDFLKNGESESFVDMHALQNFLIILHPFAPHITAELWEQVGSGDITDQEWPTYDTQKMKKETVTIAIQVNGKVRDTVVISTSATQEEVSEMVQQLSTIQKYIENAEIKKIIYIPQKIVNIVI